MNIIAKRRRWARYKSASNFGSLPDKQAASSIPNCLFRLRVRNVGHVRLSSYCPLWSKLELQPADIFPDWFYQVRGFSFARSRQKASEIIRPTPSADRIASATCERWKLEGERMSPKYSHGPSWFRCIMEPGRKRSEWAHSGELTIGFLEKQAREQSVSCL